MSDDPLGETFDVYGFECAHSVAFFWDQWAVVHIECSHGTYEGESVGLDFSEAFKEARAAFGHGHATGRHEEFTKAAP